MTDIEAAQVGRMIDTDGWVALCRPRSWVIGFYASTLPRLTYDLQELTGGGSVSNLRKGKQWYVSRFLSVVDLLTRIAPWSYKAQAALKKIHSS